MCTRSVGGNALARDSMLSFEMLFSFHFVMSSIVVFMMIMVCFISCLDAIHNENTNKKLLFRINIVV